jgi:hypothetical protein
VLDCLDAGSPSGASALASPEAPYGRTGGLSFPARGHLTNKRLSRRFTRRGAVTWIAGTIEIRSMLGAEPCRAAGAFRTSHRREQGTRHREPESEPPRSRGQNQRSSIVTRTESPVTAPRQAPTRNWRRIVRYARRIQNTRTAPSCSAQPPERKRVASGVLTGPSSCAISRLHSGQLLERNQGNSEGSNDF